MPQFPDPQSLLEEAQKQLDKARSVDALEEVRITWLGRKEGRLTVLLKQLGTLSLDEKKRYGPQLNDLKTNLETLLVTKEKNLTSQERAKALEQDTFDTSLPGTPLAFGHHHPLTQVMDSLVTIFRSLGFVCADGPEIENDYYNFEALNVPADHPARDMQDTFYLAQGQGQGSQQALFPEHGSPSSEPPTLLRTHTSPVQIRVMQKFPPPIAIVCPGRVYRHEALDATHLAVFHQMEGLLVDEGVSFADLKGTLARFAQLLFAPTTKTRFRPSFFPFTEPSAQMDVSCWVCQGAGCPTCKNLGWIELLGAGMVNPKVLVGVNIDPEKYSGFAFGVGIERIAFIKYGVTDLRLFYENDIRFLEQF
jgi:phenylalanyl-tRNA synthetase alpha chain